MGYRIQHIIPYSWTLPSGVTLYCTSTSSGSSDTRRYTSCWYRPLEYSARWYRVYQVAYWCTGANRWYWLWVVYLYWGPWCGDTICIPWGWRQIHVHTTPVSQ